MVLVAVLLQQQHNQMMIKQVMLVQMVLVEAQAAEAAAVLVLVVQTQVDITVKLKAAQVLLVKLVELLQAPTLVVTVV